ncbi:peptide ABC transporter permease [Orenia metallireducens]|uniref:Peptide ABC transporter permease n=1 Tax=Orenia metallireducens TaxID=1413210 RepID=A0A1C0AAP9_9FIRM|nr:ABC transporter permease [Orenia metallireducens]OCL27370.1 peptide ABC transporter permease [Orenia metallireducens]
MYGKYALKRIIHMLLTFIIIIFIYSALFNTVMERTLEAQITEQVRGEIIARSNMTAKEIEVYKVERVKSLRLRYHLDDPILSRIFWRGVDIITLNWGDSTIITSLEGSRDVKKIIAEVIPNTLILFTTAIALDILIGILLGIKKAQKPNKLLDQSTSIITMIVYGMPSWWLAMIMIMVFVYIIPIFPSGGLHSVPPPEGFAYYLDILYHLALPVITLIIIGFWGRAYLTRNIVLGTLQEDYIMSARARGLPESKVLYGHALRSAAPPIVTMGVMSLLMSVSGSLVYEGIFSWPGMGNLYWISVQQNDIPVLLGLLSVTTALYLGGLVFLDLIYGFLDPRIKVGDKK